MKEIRVHYTVVKIILLPKKAQWFISEKSENKANVCLDVGRRVVGEESRKPRTHHTYTLHKLTFQTPVLVLNSWTYKVWVEKNGLLDTCSQEDGVGAVILQCAAIGGKMQKEDMGR